MKKALKIGLILSVLALIVGLWLFRFELFDVQAKPAQTQSIPVNINDLFIATNLARSQNGMKPLVLNDQLNQTALNKCNDMVNRHYYAHETPDGEKPWVFFKGIQYTEAAENLAPVYKDSQTVIDKWMASPTHKANILDDDLTDVGFAICADNVVQHFIAK